MKEFYIYITDTFSGELNYSWVTKFKVKANTIRGAVCKVSRETGLKFRNDYCEIYKATNACIGLYVEPDNDFLSYDYSEAAEL